MILDRCREIGDNVIVLTQRRHVATMVHRYVQQGGFNSFLIDGDMGNKQAVVNAFTKCCQKNWAVLCATTVAGGVGLNIQAANRVVFADIRYSPNAEEQQAICRALRFGQKKPVWVYSISVAHSVDEPIGHISTHKKDLFDFVIDNGLRQQGDVRARDRTAADKLPRLLPTPEPGQLRLPRRSDACLRS